MKCAGYWQKFVNYDLENSILSELLSDKMNKITGNWVSWLKFFDDNRYQFTLNMWFWKISSCDIIY